MKYNELYALYGRGGSCLECRYCIPLPDGRMRCLRHQRSYDDLEDACSAYLPDLDSGEVTLDTILWR